MPRTLHGQLKAGSVALGLAVSLGLAVPAGAADQEPYRPEQRSAEAFTEAARSVGIDFVHFNGMSGDYYFPEIVGAGGGFFDFDSDGDLDVYLVQGHMVGEGKSAADATFPPAPGTRLNDRLLRNDLLGPGGTSTGRLHFTDVTAASGIAGAGYGMGVTAADFDNDGWVDLYVTNFGENQLLRNLGNGTFADVTEKAGVGDARWSVSAAFVDFDRDGWLDLFVGNYVRFDFAKNEPCYAPDGTRDYCSPLSFKPEPCRLLRNRGDGTFEDVSGKSGILAAYGGALGVVAADFNGDGWPDLYVANDGRANQLWINQRDGTFVDDAFMSGAGVNMDGAAEASMGVDAGDFDGDGDEDLFMTHILEETNTLYVNDGKGWFQDRSVATGIAVPSQGYTAFGTAWVDYDNDGWLDLFIANGDVRTIAALVRAGDPYPLHQPNQLLANRGGRRFEDVTAEAGKAFTLSEVSRGAAFGDVDNDGDIDVLLTNNSGRARLMLNGVGNRRHWLGLHLLERSGRDALGARVAVRLDGHRTLWRRVRADGSFASSNDPRLLVGLGEATRILGVDVHWPDGTTESWGALPIDRYHRLRQGEKKAKP